MEKEDIREIRWMIDALDQAIGEGWQGVALCAAITMLIKREADRLDDKAKKEWRDLSHETEKMV